MHTPAQESVDEMRARLDAERRRGDRWLRRDAIVAAVLILVVWAWSSWAIDGTPYAEETITVSNSAVGLTAGLCTQSGVVNPALLQVKTNPIYFTLNSATATPDSGDYEAAAGTFMEVQRPDRWRAIRSGGADASVKATCFQR
jgi:hypothetical protein